MSKKAVLIDPAEEILNIKDLKRLHKFIVKNVANELSELVADCYYPKLVGIINELYHQCGATRKQLTKYSLNKYKNPNHRLLHDPTTTLIIKIVQEFMLHNDLSAAISAFNLLALRTYSNAIHKFIQFCNPIYFKTALESLSHNHLFNLKKTIPSAIMYLSSDLFRRYEKALKTDDADKLYKLIYEIRSRFVQSVRSFADKYYKIADNQTGIAHSDHADWDVSRGQELKGFISTMSKDMTLYKNSYPDIALDATKLTKFNKVSAAKYVVKLMNPKYTELVSTAMYLILEPIKDYNVIHTVKYLDYIKSLMSIKVSKKPLYFKKEIIAIHDMIIKDLHLSKWMKSISIQTLSASRGFIAYYIALYVRKYINSD